MIIKKIYGEKVKDSRGEDTIQVTVKTKKGKFKTASPAGKSTGKYEVKSYAKSLDEDIKEIGKIDLERLNSLSFKKFNDLAKIEKIVFKKIGGNSLYALEASLLKAMAKENKLELWEFIRQEIKNQEKTKIRSVGNSIGGGLHSRGIDGKKPDFQEFLFIADCEKFSDCVKWNKKAYKMIGKILGTKNRNDEGAWETNLTNEEVLKVMSSVREKIKTERGIKMDIGIDVASSSFYDGDYNYTNPKRRLSAWEQIKYLNQLVKEYDIFYLEDGLDEKDFSGFRGLTKKGLIVGDDLTTTNLERLEKAIRMKSINGIIVKPNQIGSLLEVRRVIELAKNQGIKTIISHRSGETTDNTIADLGAGFGCDFIKTGIYGKVRRAKLKRLIKIQRKLK